MKTIEDWLTIIGQSITLKIVIIGFLVLLLIIPTIKIQQLIDERSHRRDQVMGEVTDKWGTAQSIAGPALLIPYSELITVDNKQAETRKDLLLFPEVLIAEGHLIPEVRYRSIYKVIVYNSEMDLRGVFDLSELRKLSIPVERIEWDKACLQVGVSDLRGIQDEVNLLWADVPFPVEPGLLNENLGHSGITVKLPIALDKEMYDFSLKLNVRGSDHLYVTPAGKSTSVHLTSPWTTPSFTGAFLPDKRNISSTGFDAEWKVNQLNRNFPQVWINNNYDVSQSAFGVSLLFPTDEYQKSMRTVKYAILFISLTFLIFILIEIINKIRVHPVQYLLISFGLLIFYTLLISLSEHLGFNRAYLISSSAIVGLIAIYSLTIFKKVRLTLIMLIAIGCLYTFLFTIIQLQDYALLMGSLGLFIILGLVMYLTRKINWYKDSV